MEFKFDPTKTKTYECIGISKDQYDEAIKKGKSIYEKMNKYRHQDIEELQSLTKEELILIIDHLMASFSQHLLLKEIVK